MIDGCIDGGLRSAGVGERIFGTWRGVLPWASVLNWGGAKHRGLAITVTASAKSHTVHGKRTAMAPYGIDQILVPANVFATLCVALTVRVPQTEKRHVLVLSVRGTVNVMTPERRTDHGVWFICGDAALNATKDETRKCQIVPMSHP